VNAIKDRVERKSLVPLLQINSSAVAKAYEWRSGGKPPFLTSRDSPWPIHYRGTENAEKASESCHRSILRLLSSSLFLCG